MGRPQESSRRMCLQRGFLCFVCAVVVVHASRLPVKLHVENLDAAMEMIDELSTTQALKDQQAKLRKELHEDDIEAAWRHVQSRLREEEDLPKVSDIDAQNAGNAGKYIQESSILDSADEVLNGLPKPESDADKFAQLGDELESLSFARPGQRKDVQMKLKEDSTRSLSQANELAELDKELDDDKELLKLKREAHKRHQEARDALAGL